MIENPEAGAGGPAVASESGDSLEGFSGWHQIGRGGDAIVYRATQDALDREVAIKVLSVDDEASMRRFIREVQLMVQLGRQHPNIAKVLQIGRSTQGRPCIVMDYYELGSLDQRLSRVGPLSADEVIRVGTVIADALAFAHAKGVLHRDVKPQNILILPTSYVLADFGIARLIDSAYTAGSDRFSYRHASPQVLDGLPPCELDDVFSLGATMFHLLAGQPPFSSTDGEGDSALAYIKRVRISEPNPLPRTDVPPGLVELIQRCLCKNPANRFQSAAEVRDALAAFPTDWPGAPVLAPERPTFQPPRSEADAEWGVAPGQVSEPDDLTSVRLAPPQVPGLVPAPRTRRVSRLGVVLAGVLAGILLVILVSLWLRPGGTPNTPAAPPAGNPSDAATITHNPNLAPRDLQITVSGDTATATWQRAIDEPEVYGWGVTANPADQASIDRRNLPSNRTATATIDPSWTQVCFTVVGMRDGQIGGTQDCVPR